MKKHLKTKYSIVNSYVICFVLPSARTVLMAGPHVRDLAMTAQERTEPSTNIDEW